VGQCNVLEIDEVFADIGFTTDLIYVTYIANYILETGPKSGQTTG
jgi:hypothetical protein